MSYFIMHCPGCHENHGFDERWTVKDPTDPAKIDIHPSHRQTFVRPDGTQVTCHMTIAAGEIHFADDCTHEMRSTRVPMKAEYLYH